MRTKTGRRIVKYGRRPHEKNKRKATFSNKKNRKSDEAQNSLIPKKCFCGGMSITSRQRQPVNGKRDASARVVKTSLQGCKGLT
jgi:hypothetical protein